MFMLCRVIRLKSLFPEAMSSKVDIEAIRKLWEDRILAFVRRAFPRQKLINFRGRMSGCKDTSGSNRATDVRVPVRLIARLE